MEALLNKMQRLGLVMMTGGFVSSRFFFVVDGGERALLYDKTRGIQTKVYGEGMHFYIPMI